MKKFLKLISILTILTLVCAGCSQKAPQQTSKPATPAEVIVTVDGIDYNVERFNLYFYDVQDNMLKEAGYSSASNIPKNFWTDKIDGKTRLDIAIDEALANLTDNAVAYKNAVDAKIKITAEDESYIENQILMLQQDNVRAAQLDNIGISVEEYKKHFTESAYISYYVKELMDDNKINLDEVDNEAIIEQFTTDYRKAKHILISTVDAATGAAMSDAQKKQAEAKAQEVLAKLNAGEDFDTLMNEYCEDPGLAESPDGYVFTRGQMVAPFEKAAFAMEENEVSGLVPTDYGYHIIKRVPLNLEAEEEKGIINSMVQEEAITNYIRTIKAKSDIKINNEVVKKVKPTIGI